MDVTKPNAKGERDQNRDPDGDGGQLQVLERLRRDEAAVVPQKPERIREGVHKLAEALGHEKSIASCWIAKLSPASVKFPVQFPVRLTMMRVMALRHKLIFTATKTAVVATLTGTIDAAELMYLDIDSHCTQPVVSRHSRAPLGAYPAQRVIAAAGRQVNSARQRAMKHAREL